MAPDTGCSLRPLGRHLPGHCKHVCVRVVCSTSAAVFCCCVLESATRPRTGTRCLVHRRSVAHPSTHPECAATPVTVDTALPSRAAVMFAASLHCISSELCPAFFAAIVRLVVPSPMPVRACVLVVPLSYAPVRACVPVVPLSYARACMCARCAPLLCPCVHVCSLCPSPVCPRARVHDAFAPSFFFKLAQHLDLRCTLLPAP